MTSPLLSTWTHKSPLKFRSNKCRCWTRSPHLLSLIRKAKILKIQRKLQLSVPQKRNRGFRREKASSSWKWWIWRQADWIRYCSALNAKKLSPNFAMSWTTYGHIQIRGPMSANTASRPLLSEAIETVTRQWKCVGLDRRPEMRTLVTKKFD